MRGFHGTSRCRANQVYLEGYWDIVKIKSSLGEGIYFFTDQNEKTALENAFKYPFSREVYFEPIRVISAEITPLGFPLFDLTDPDTNAVFEKLKSAYIEKASGTPSEKIFCDKRKLSSAILEDLCRLKNISVIKANVRKPDFWACRQISCTERTTCLCVKNTGCISNAFVRGEKNKEVSL